MSRAKASEDCQAFYEKRSASLEEHRKDPKIAYRPVQCTSALTIERDRTDDKCGDTTDYMHHYNRIGDEDGLKIHWCFPLL